MSQPSKDKLIRTLLGRLDSERVLGGKWLEVGGHIEDAPLVEMPIEEQEEAPVAKKKTSGSNKDKKLQLADVAETIAACTKCPLHKSRINPVPGDGNPNAQIVFVGEAPGQNEDEQGKPFVGRAGKLLTKIIEAMGLKREDVFICNILKSRPPDNRDPRPEEIVACMDYLFEQIAIIEPQVIVALGSHAAKTLLNTTEAIGKLRGRFHEYQPGPFAKPVKLVATYHPAYLLRNYTKETRQRVWDDMKMVLNEVGLPVPRRQA